jgi:delta24-sterol reductase
VDASPDGHLERVARIVRDVRARMARPASARRRLCTARAPWQNLSTRFSDYKKHSDCIFVGDLRSVIALDAGRELVTLEPLVDVGMATRWLLPRGYMLATTLEIEEATVGGLACAVGMTTASHKYGLLQETVEEYEIVLGDGRLVKARRDNEYADLWHAFPWSHGSLGLLVGLTLRVIPVTSHVRVDYTPVTGGVDAYATAIREASLRDPSRPFRDGGVADFVEATVFSRQDCVVMEASFVRDGAEVEPARVNHVGRWYKKWFYTHVRDMVGDGGGKRHEFVPTYEYIFRHNRGIFWTLRDQLPERIGNNVVFRFLLGWLNPPKVTFLKLPATPEIRREMMVERVYQDIVLPLRTLEDAIALAGSLFEIWPILVYPSRIYDHGAAARQGQFRQPRKQDLVPGTNYAMYYDLGVYGIPAQIMQGGAARANFKPVTAMRQMEAFTRKNRGAPFLYANTFMDRDEFGEMFDLALYEKVRAKYGADEHFHHLFDKTSGCQSYDFQDMLDEESKKKKV